MFGMNKKGKVKVLVIGYGADVNNELRKVNRQDFDYVIGVNQAAIDFGPVDYHVTLHPERYWHKKAGWMVSWKQHKGVDETLSHQWTRGGKSGSSGLFAVKYALERLKADSVTLAGVGMDNTPHFNGDKPWGGHKEFQKVWEQVADQLRGKVESLGGWSKELLNPTAEEPENNQHVFHDDEVNENG